MYVYEWCSSLLPRIQATSVTIDNSDRIMYAVGDAVKTPYGEGIVKDVRQEQIVVEPSTWLMAGGQKPAMYLAISDVQPSYKVGDAVRTLFGVGKIVEIRTEGVPFVVQLDDWKLASAESPFLYLAAHSLKKEPTSMEAATSKEVGFDATV